MEINNEPELSITGSRKDPGEDRSLLSLVQVCPDLSVYVVRERVSGQCRETGPGKSLRFVLVSVPTVIGGAHPVKTGNTLYSVSRFTSYKSNGKTIV